MNKVEVLIEGCAKQIKNGWIASSTVTLIESNNKKIIVDPGCDRKRLEDKLTEVNLSTRDIDYVFLTHNHTDHTLLAGIFENAKVLVGSEIYSNEYQYDHKDCIKELDIRIIQTPGHSNDSRSFIVETEEGTFAIAGDLFWWTDNEEQKIDIESLLSHHDLYAKNKAILRESRQKVLDLANFVIPGHGKIFKVNEQ